MKPDLIDHVIGKNIGRFPVWMMRQAGRYLPQYKELREQHTFWESVKDPKLAAEISLQPLDVLALDAVILFSDILTLPEALGIPISMVESVGPVIERPLDQVGAFDVFQNYDPMRHTPYVTEALGIISKKIQPATTLIGFAGAPWTVASYLVEGKGSKHFAKLKAWMYQDPQSLAKALDLLGEATVRYLSSQLLAGAHLVQLFDTWASEMPLEFFEKYYHGILQKMFVSLQSNSAQTIYFAKGAQHLWHRMRDLPVTGMGIDSLVSLVEAEHRLGENYFLQGNLDPVVLLGADVGTVRRMTRELVGEARRLKKPAVLNLGHGILPATPFENVQAFVEEARTLWI